MKLEKVAINTAEQRFVKGTEEYELFNDFWKLCQSFWVPEDTDEWRKELHNALEKFSKNGAFAEYLVVAFLREVERKYKEGK